MSATPHQVQAYLDGRLDAPARSAFEGHLAECPACRARVEAWRTFAADFKVTTAPMLEAPPVGEVNRLMARVEGRAAPARWRVPVLLTVAAAVVFAVGWFARQPVEPEVPTATLDGQPFSGDAIEATDAERTLVVDGADLAVAPRTRVKVLRRTAREVRVGVERGSVRLAVSHRKPGQDFIVESGAWRTQVVGTRFSVTHEGDAVEVKVEEGEVRVSSKDASYAVPAGSRFKGTGLGGVVERLIVEPPVVVEPAVVDAGVREEVRPPPVTDERELLEVWRRAAASGACASVIPDIRKRLQSMPRAGATWLALATCQRRLGDDGGAIVSYRNTISFSRPDDADRARLFLADLHQTRNEHADAVTVLRAFLNHKQKSSELEAAARVRLARSYLALGEQKKARVELERVTKKLPGSASALQALELLKTLSP
ncbi:MAG: FecR domain-containing protein [Myxococcales bacterium]|nr:FecR domain-containing protein [Myxococcales bacterium]